MFKIPRPNLYESSEGFSVEVLGLTGLRYREGIRQIFIDSEILAGPAGIAIYRSSIKKWDSPHESESIGEVERNRIIENIQKAFRFQGFEIHVI